ncbi:MAG: phage tail assembly chaperone [Erythrobacter cryptus]
MSATFAAAAQRCWALAARWLGWRPDEFWSATPAELAMALTQPDDPGAPAPPSRETIARLLERDAHDRRI